MFTKSGKRLVPVTIPQKNNLPPRNGSTKLNNHVNGHIDSVLEDLVSRGYTVTPITPDTTAIVNNSSTPGTIIGKPYKIAAKPDSLPRKLPTLTNSVQSKDVHNPQQRPELIKVPKRKGRRRNAKPINEPEIEKMKQEALTAITAKQIRRVASSEINPSAESSTNNKPDKKTRTIINGTEYVPYTKPQPNIVKRDRLIQVSDSIKKETQEAAVQCDEDESSSEISESDWISEIIEEYEFIEDNNMYECHLCGEVCLSQSSNFKHSLMHRESSLLCFRCGRLFSNTSKLRAHEDKMHTEDKLEIKKALRCPKINCLKAFHSQRQLFDHIDQHGTRVIEQRCAKCQRSFPSSLQLLCHVNRRNCWR